jgi:hypothetical protein
MGSKRNRGKRYTEQFEWDAAALARSSGKTVTEVARDPPGKGREHAAAREPANRSGAVALYGARSSPQFPVVRGVIGHGWGTGTFRCVALQRSAVQGHTGQRDTGEGHGGAPLMGRRPWRLGGEPWSGSS